MSARQEREQSRVRLVLGEYLVSQETAKAIAKRHGIDVKKLRAWVDAAGYSRRPRGRQPRVEPTLAQKAILRRIGSVPIAHLAQEVGKSRQYVSALAGRWRHWIAQNRPSLPALPQVQPLPSSVVGRAESAPSAQG